MYFANVCTFLTDMSQKHQEMLDLTTQIDMLTNSLSGSEFASTPVSGKFN